MDGMNGGPNLSPLKGATAAGITGGAIPVGFGMSLAMNESAMNGYAAMTEAEKEDVILRAKDAKSKKEMDEIISSLAGSDDEEVKKLKDEMK